MNLTIEQIRDTYRKSKDKDAALKDLAESEGVSVSTIKLYVRGVMSSAELIDMAVANGTVEAIIPAAILEEKPPEKKTLDAIPAKRRGRPVKNLKPCREPATPREEKAKKVPVRARPIDIVLPMLPVFVEPKPEESEMQSTHFVPVTQADREMFFADIEDDEPVELQKPQMTLLGQEVNNFDDVTRIMQEAKAAKAHDTTDPFSALRKVKEMCWPPRQGMPHTVLPFFAQTAKHDEGKVRMSLVPPSLIEAVGRVRTYGTDKYGDPDNWLQVEPWRFKDAMMRHLCEYLRDPDSVDTESGIPHLEHMACNVAFLLEANDRKKRGTCR